MLVDTKSSYHDSLSVWTLSGVLLSENHRLVREMYQLMRQIKHRGVTSLTLDLQGVMLMDSQCESILFRLFQYFKQTSSAQLILILPAQRINVMRILSYLPKHSDNFVLRFS